jgi:undecaprenyl-diphosphatase
LVLETESVVQQRRLRACVLAANLSVAFLPAAALGVALDDWIEHVLFGLWYVVAAWLAGGVAILVIARQRRRRGSQHVGRMIEQLTLSGALAIGAIQCLALWPGVSRSLVTILGGVLVGLSLPAAVEFSFLLGMVTLLAATAYKLMDTWPLMIATYDSSVMLLGSLAALVSAWLAMSWMVTYLRRHGMELFGYYRIGLAAVVGSALGFGWLAA